MGKEIPQNLLKEIAIGKKKESDEDAYNNFKSNSYLQEKPLYPPNIQKQTLAPPNKYSPQYASYVGAKPRAQASARIGLGGVF